ncbi:2OG-Fe(II) oxygenase family oxidoreductase, partial [Trifolium medium]|nr:2OG-Fe(II) oxygenase family oxidoreductase [Trifolium medium]
MLLVIGEGERELIQLGDPIFGQIKDNAKSIEPIPPLLHGVIDHLIQWELIPEYKRPNGCIINFFEEGIQQVIMDMLYYGYGIQQVIPGHFGG